MIRVRVAPVEDFKRCCMLSGEFDGSDRDYFFQVIALCHCGSARGPMACVVPGRLTSTLNCNSN